VPAVFRSKKKTIGIRIPNHDVTIEIIKQLGNPMMATSLHDDDHPVSDYLTDPSEIFEKFESIVDLIIDSGNGGNIPSTIVDCTKGEAVIVREGLGVI
jgi:tRNA threonylcarbamoyl adenosine modification protein (Sua5/YciO/YrdC/YwlC family)